MNKIIKLLLEMALLEWIDFWEVEVLIRFWRKTSEQGKLSHEGGNIYLGDLSGPFLLTI